MDIAVLAHLELERLRQARREAITERKADYKETDLFKVYQVPQDLGTIEASAPARHQPSFKGIVVIVEVGGVGVGVGNCVGVCVGIGVGICVVVVPISALDVVPIIIVALEGF